MDLIYWKHEGGGVISDSLDNYIGTFSGDFKHRDRLICAVNDEAKLRTELAAAKAEIDDVKQVQFPRKLRAVAEGWKKQLAARDLVISKMRAVLVEMSRQCVSDWPALREALALQPTTEALDAYVQEQLRAIISQNVIEVQRAKEEVRDKCAAKCEGLIAQDSRGLLNHNLLQDCAAAIREMVL